MTAREHVLSAIRRRLHRAPGQSAGAADARIAAHPRSLVPARARLPHAEQVALFAQMATEQAAALTRVASLAEVPGAVAAYLDAHGLGRRLRVAPALAGLDWSGLEAAPGRAEADDPVSVTPVFAAVAETGTVVLVSGPDTPTSLNFLPDTHVVVVRAVEVVGCYEDAWERLRTMAGDMPRTVNLVTGPSRTGDIEQTIQLGAHGPRRLLVVLVDGDGA